MSIELKIKTKIEHALTPIFLQILNESKYHRGSTSPESHFRLEIVSDKFIGKKTLARHRFVQDLLKEELSLIKAFSLHTFTPDEWHNMKANLEKSPSCRGSNE